MCNRYLMRAGRGAILDATRAMYASDAIGNLGPLDVFPNRDAPIVRHRPDGERELVMARWGMPSSQTAIRENADKRMDKERVRRAKKGLPDLTPDEVATYYRMEPDGGTTNVRNTASSHWRRWLNPESRCLVPLTVFAEPDQVGGTRKDTFFALSEDQPLAFFAGIQTRDWGSVRQISKGWETLDLYAFLTTTPQPEVAPFHNKASTVILRTEEEREIWMRAPWDEAKDLQKPLPAGSLVVLSTGGVVPAP